MKFGKKNVASWESKISPKSFSSTVSKINAFLSFTQIFNIAAENGEKTIFGEGRQMNLRIPWG